MSVEEKPFVKIYIRPLKPHGRLKRYVAYVYTVGDRRASVEIKYIRIPRAILYYFKYRQSLVGETVRIRERKYRYGTGWILEFMPGMERIAQLYMLYLIGLSELRSSRKADKLARCISNIDPVMPILDAFMELRKHIGNVRFRRVIQAYCKVR